MLGAGGSNPSAPTKFNFPANDFGLLQQAKHPVMGRVVLPDLTEFPFDETFSIVPTSYGDFGGEDDLG